MDNYETALQLLPGRLVESARRTGPGAEEFRLRRGRRATVVIKGREYALAGEAISREELYRVMEKATGASLHSVDTSLSRGFLLYRGLRIGLCGSLVRREGKLVAFRDFSSLAIRIPRECKGCCDELYRSLYAQGFENTLLLAPPGGGKTTALRELIRLLSEHGRRMSVVDERGELAGDCPGGPCYDLGTHTDVLSFAEKGEGIMMLLRSMNPEIIAVDEITQESDLHAVIQAFGCGVGLLATAHASDVSRLSRRPLYEELLRTGCFTRAVEIKAENGQRSYTVRKII